VNNEYNTYTHTHTHTSTYTECTSWREARYLSCTPLSLHVESDATTVAPECFNVFPWDKSDHITLKTTQKDVLFSCCCCVEQMFCFATSRSKSVFRSLWQTVLTRKTSKNAQLAVKLQNIQSGNSQKEFRASQSTQHSYQHILHVQSFLYGWDTILSISIKLPSLLY